MTGMRMSIQIKSGDSFLNAATASLPFLASMVKKPTSSSKDLSNRRFSRLSSAIRIRRVFYPGAKPMTLGLVSMGVSTSATSTIPAGSRTRNRVPFPSVRAWPRYRGPAWRRSRGWRSAACAVHGSCWPGIDFWPGLPIRQPARPVYGV